MIKWRRGLLSIFCLLLVADASAQSEKGNGAKSFPVVEIKGSEVRTLKSKDTGRDYDLYIQAPKSANGDQKYPVLFVLDGQWDFKLLDSVYGGLRYDKFVPEMVIVGITYSGERANYDALRAMDFTPTPVARHNGSGDAAKFLAFLKKDLIPLIEKDYRGDPARRVLLGSSFGGLFTLYAMFSEPELFYGYIAASPAVPYDGNFSFRQEKQYAERRKDLPVKLYIAVGGAEELEQPVRDFIKTVGSRSYEKLKLETRVVEGERHAGNKPEAFNRGLRFIFGNE